MHDCRREGDERLSGTDKAESRPADAEQESAVEKAKGRKKRGAAPGDLGRALRTVYDQTLQEEVPEDFLDLLGKLE